MLVDLSVGLSVGLLVQHGKKSGSEWHEMAMYIIKFRSPIMSVSGPRNCTIWSVSGPRIIVAPFLPFLGPEIAVFRPVKGARSPLAREKMKKFKDSKLATQL